MGATIVALPGEIHILGEEKIPDPLPQSKMYKRVIRISQLELLVISKGVDWLKAKGQRAKK